MSDSAISPDTKKDPFSITPRKKDAAKSDVNRLTLAGVDRDSAIKDSAPIPIVPGCNGYKGSFPLQIMLKPHEMNKLNEYAYKNGLKKAAIVRDLMRKAGII